MYRFFIALFVTVTVAVYTLASYADDAVPNAFTDKPWKIVVTIAASDGAVIQKMAYRVDKHPEAQFADEESCKVFLAADATQLAAFLELAAKVVEQDSTLKVTEACEIPSG